MRRRPPSSGCASGWSTASRSNSASVRTTPAWPSSEVHGLAGRPSERGGAGVAIRPLTIAGTLTGAASAAPTPSGALRADRDGHDRCAGRGYPRTGRDRALPPRRRPAERTASPRDRRLRQRPPGHRYVSANRITTRSLQSARTGGECRGLSPRMPARPGPTRACSGGSHPRRRPNRRTRSPSSRRAAVRRRQRRRRPSFRRRTPLCRGPACPAASAMPHVEKNRTSGGNDRRCGIRDSVSDACAPVAEAEAGRPVAWQWQASVRAPAKRAR